jgi:integrase
MVNMTWKENNTGHLRRHQNGYYHLEIPHTEFKNPQSSFFGPPGRERPFKVELSGVVTSLLDEYLFRCRPYLIEKWMMSKNSEGGVEDEGFLFISSSCGKSQRISYSSAAVIVVDFSIEHLVYNPLTETGLKGVESFAPHSFRHIFATHVLKDTGSFANAGAAIQDSEATARRYYAQYQPSDRDKQYRQTIKDLMEEENE